MTDAEAHELLARYPTVTHAVSFVELFVDAPEGGDPETAMDWMRQAGVSPAEALVVIRGCVADEVKLGTPGRHREALAELELPEFMTYLCGKLGAV